MKNKLNLPGELSLVIGLVMISIAIPLMVKAIFGISTISSLPFALSAIDGHLSFGAWNLIFQACLLVILVAITRRFKPGYVISLLLSASFGLTLDLFSGLLSGLPVDLWMRLAYFVASYLIMCVAIALMVGSRVPVMVVDAFISDLSVHFQVTFRRMKTLFDLICVTISVAASVAFLGDLAGVGVGTVIMALLTGSGVHLVNVALNRVIVIRPWSRRLQEMAE